MAGIMGRFFFFGWGVGFEMDYMASLVVCSLRIAESSDASTRFLDVGLQVIKRCSNSGSPIP